MTFAIRATKDTVRLMPSSTSIVAITTPPASALSAMGPVLKSASDTALPEGVRSLAALVAGTHLTGTDPAGARLDRAGRTQGGLASACQQAASSGHTMPAGARFEGTC